MTQWRSELREINRAALMRYRGELCSKRAALSRSEFRDLDATERFLKRTSYECYPRQAIELALQDGAVIIDVDATRDDVLVPDHVRRTNARLQFNLDDPEDLWIDDDGVHGSLTFGGVDHWCVIPWTAVWGFTGKRSCAFWRENMPMDVVEWIQRDVAEINKPAEPMPRPVFVPDEKLDPLLQPTYARLRRCVKELRAIAMAEIAAEDRNDAAIAAIAEARPPIGPGDRVRFTRKALRSMYGVNGHGLCKAPDRRWTVVACGCGLCASGRFVAVDELDTYGEGQRHMNLANVERCPFARTEPTEAESSTLLAEQWEQLGVDVEAGICRRPMP